VSKFCKYILIPNELKMRKDHHECYLPVISAHKTKESFNQVWWSTPVIPALRRLRQNYYKLQANLGYIVRICLKTKQHNNNKTKSLQVGRNCIGYLVQPFSSQMGTSTQGGHILP
jgi:hypothetical protein